MDGEERRHHVRSERLRGPFKVPEKRLRDRTFTLCVMYLYPLQHEPCSEQFFQKTPAAPQDPIQIRTETRSKCAVSRHFFPRFVSAKCSSRRGGDNAVSTYVVDAFTFDIGLSSLPPSLAFSLHLTADRGEEQIEDDCN